MVNLTDNRLYDMVSVILKTDILLQDNTLPVMIPIVATQVPEKLDT